MVLDHRMLGCKTINQLHYNDHMKPVVLTGSMKNIVGYLILGYLIKNVCPLSCFAGSNSPTYFAVILINDQIIEVSLFNPQYISAILWAMVWVHLLILTCS
jgi:hypothetical protein